MYGKLFMSTFTGSMYGAGADVFAVWGYAIAHAVGGQVELNPRYLAPVLGMTVEAVEAAITFLEAPDPNSRSKTHGGSRLVRLAQFAYEMPNHGHYTRMKHPDDVREANRLNQQAHRARKAGAAP